MKRYIVITFTIIAILFGGVAIKAKAQVPSVYQGVYNGVLDKIEMRGKSYEAKPAVFRVEGDRLRCDFPKIGRMPGSIALDIPIKIDENGVITATDTKVGTLKMLFLKDIPLTLVKMSEAQIKDGKLTISLDITGKFLGFDFPASVHFVGNR